MKKLLIIQLLFIPLIGFAQESRLTHSTFFSPNYAYRYLNTFEEAMPIKKHRDTIDHHMFGFQAGQLAHYNVGKYTSLISGIAFSDMGHRQDINIPFYNINGELIKTSNLNIFYHRTYFDIPLILETKMNNDRLSFYNQLGMEVNFLLNSYELGLIDGEPQSIRIISTEKVDKLNFSARAAFGASYLINSRTSIYGAFSAKYQLKPITSREILEYDYLGGMMFGIRYHIK